MVIITASLSKMVQHLPEVKPQADGTSIIEERVLNRLLLPAMKPGDPQVALEAALLHNIEPGRKEAGRLGHDGHACHRGHRRSGLGVRRLRGWAQNTWARM